MGAAIDLEGFRIGDQRVTPTELAILRALLRAGGKPVPARRLIDAMYADDEDGGALQAKNVLTTMIWRLRRKLDGTGYVINAVRGFGYWLAGPSDARLCPCCGRAME